MSDTSETEVEQYSRPWYLKTVMAAMLVMVPLGFPLGIFNAGAGNFLLAGGIYIAMVVLITVLAVAYFMTGPEFMNGGHSA